MNLKPYFATPSYGGQVTAEYHLSMLATVLALAKQGIRCGIPDQPLCDSLVPRARGVFAAKFLLGSCDPLFFIDADLQWSPASVLRILHVMEACPDIEVACGVYPLKCHPPRFPINFFSDSDGRVLRHPKCGYVEIRDAPTGFLAIRRSALKQLIERYPERKCVFLPEAPAEEQALYHDLFPTGPEKLIFGYADSEEAGEMYLSEDFGFSRLWQRAGGRVWMDPEIQLGHWGRERFTGSVKDWLEPVPDEEAETERLVAAV